MPEQRPSDPIQEPAVVGSGYDIVVALFCSMLLISNLSAVKLISFGPDVELFGFPVLPLIMDGGALLFPLTYIFGDVLAEVYGWRGAKRAIYAGLGVSVLAAVTFWLVGLAPAAAEWTKQEAYDDILGFVPRIALASLAGYLVGQLSNAWTLVSLKRRNPTGSLWSRLLGSTVIGEAADTAVFCVVAFGGLVSGATLVNYVVVGYLFKCSVELVLLPVTYRVIGWLKNRPASRRSA